jgi:hypothetical protein
MSATLSRMILHRASTRLVALALIASASSRVAAEVGAVSRGGDGFP